MVANTKNRKFNSKIIILGEGTVGKTSLRRSYLGKSFRANYLQTIGADFSVTQNEFDGVHCQTSLWDIAGQLKYEATHASYFRGSHGAIIVFDVTNRFSFDNIDKWVSKFLELSKVQSVISIVGNKTDLQAVVTEKELYDKVADFKIKYPDLTVHSFLTSAINGKNIKECVETTILSILHKFMHNSHKFQRKVKNNYETYIPAAYILTYDEALGPVILKKSPSYGTFSDKEFINSIKVASTIDLDALAGSPHVAGVMPWNDPPGSFHYFAFTDFIEGDEKVFIFGFVSNRDVDDLISSNHEMISGYFHNTMNNFNLVLKKNDCSVHDIANSTVELDSILLNFRLEVFKLIEDEI